ncbi:MAG: sulfotransferase [Bacteroidia bacterium]|nr:sulfotransferase [Bacteroidia bacterium]
MKDWSRERINNLKIHFIFCMERTGSSMLTSMLNRNEYILSSSEEPFVLYLYKKYKDKKTYTKAEIDTLVEEFWLTSERMLVFYYESKENLKQLLYSFLPNLDYLFLCKVLYLNFIPLKSKDKVEVIVDKQMKYMYYIEVIREIFPDAKILFLVRNPKGVVTSWRKRKWGLNQTAAYLATLYKFNYSFAKKAFESKVPNIDLLRYEDLVSSPAKELERICKFYQVPFNIEMVEHHTAYNAYVNKMEEFVDDSRIKHVRKFQGNTLKPVTTELIDEWQGVLSTHEISTIDKINKELNLFFNYPSHIGNYKFTLSNWKNIILGSVEKGWYQITYINSPLWIKVLIKKIKYGVFKGKARWEKNSQKSMPIN